MTTPPTKEQLEAMRVACGRGDMPSLPPPPWDINTSLVPGGWSMLHSACGYGHVPLARQLLSVGASRDPPIDPNTTCGTSGDSAGVTPLWLAACSDQEAVVRMLVARPDVDVNKGSPLVIACRYRHVSVVALLECPRVDVNLVQTIGWGSLVGKAALHVACEQQFMAGVKLLLQVNGIDANCGTFDGETPLDVATRCNFPKICDLLKDHNARIVQSSFLDSTAKNKDHDEITELKARITKLEDENAKNVNLHYERRDEQQRICDLQHYSTIPHSSGITDTNHVMSHVEQGEGTWCNILPETNNNKNNNCKQSQIRIVFEDLAPFDEIVCASCPLQMVVKIIISRKFGVEPTQQAIFTVGSDDNHSEELLTDPSKTLEEIQQQQQQGGSTNRVVVQIRVRIKSSMTIQEKDLKVVSTLGVGSYGTVFKCTFIHNTATSSSSTPSETTTSVAVKALHECIKSEFNITQFQQEAGISSSLRHTNIVRCLGTCTTSTGSLWIVSELMELSLRQLLRHKDLTFMEVVSVASGIAKGMTALHRRNNVLLDSHGVPKIADFGLSRALQGSSESSGGCHYFTDRPGTVSYLPPQMHTPHYGIKGDMWEFAVLLSVILRGATPEVRPPKSANQITEFLAVQQTSLSSEEVSELNRLCQGDPGEVVVVECLSRRNAIISSLCSDPKMNNVHRVCVSLFSLVVESCLSILESNRPSFPAIERMLMTCAGMVFESSTTTTVVTNNILNSNNCHHAMTKATQQPACTTTKSYWDVVAHINTCLSNIATTFPFKTTHDAPTTQPPSITGDFSKQCCGTSQGDTLPQLPHLKI
ncbi:Protein tyrosine and serine/threonine kinase [Pelomyxa schiedti]|nr:Protein tyrosine and serine/threonine kinase [Pelomyxa schiedti]